MKKNFKILLAVLLLVLIDQSIKIYISNNSMDKHFNLIGSIIGFQPYINAEYSWINAISNMGINLLTHIILNIVVIIITLIAFDFIQEKYSTNKYVKCFFSFLLAGGLCSLIDKVAWGGSLDYILLKGFFIFDLKDLYISTFEVMILVGLIINYKAFGSINEELIYKEFKAYIKVKYLKKKSLIS